MPDHFGLPLVMEVKLDPLHGRRPQSGRDQPLQDRIAGPQGKTDGFACGRFAKVLQRLKMLPHQRCQTLSLLGQDQALSLFGDQLDRKELLKLP